MRWSLAVAIVAASAVIAAAQASTGTTSGSPTTGHTTTYLPHYATEVRFSQYNTTAVTADWSPRGCDGGTFLEVRADDQTAWRRFPAEPPVRVDGLSPSTFYQVRVGVGCSGMEPTYGCFRTPPGYEWCRTQHPTAGPRTQTTTLPPGVARIANVTMLARSEHEATLGWELDVLGCSTAATILELYLVESPVGTFYPPASATATYVPSIGRQQAQVAGLVSSGAYLARFDFHGTCPGQATARLADHCFQTRPAPMGCTEAQWPGAGNFTSGTLPPSKSSAPTSQARPEAPTGSGLRIDGTGTGRVAQAAGEGTTSTGGEGTTTTGATAQAAAAGIAVLAVLFGAVWVRRRLP